MSEPSEMVKRVADAIGAAIAGGTSMATPLRLEMARAAIAAMREPTESMLVGGFFADDTEFAGETSIAEIWSAMIDAALS